MKLSAEDYRSHYRSLSDEELLAMDPAELVDLARRCYQAELERRHLQREQAVDAEEMEPEESAPREPAAPAAEEMVQIGLLSDRRSAMEAQQVLLDANLPAEVTTEPTLPGHFALGTFGLLVPASCADDARELIAGALAGSNQDLVRRWLEQEWAPDGMELTEFHVTIDDLFGEGEKVAARLTAQGVDSQTGRDVKFGVIAIVHVVNGKISENWIKLDSPSPS
ncbi:MAG TPA: ester cyclase [Candidatus Acidoferrales bacterium]|nr:ester cyclase [Candidatus Acidoferrales bacterium]